MDNIGTLYRYELKKIYNRKIVWITGGIMCLLCLFLSFSDLISISASFGSEKVSGYEMMKADRESARALSGRMIDDQLLQEMQEFYLKKKTASEDAGEEMTYSMQRYSPIYSYVHRVVKDDRLALSIDSEGLYKERGHLISQNRADQLLTNGEVDYWENTDRSVETPFIYQYSEGWSNLWKYAYVLNYMLLLLLAICLPNVFSTEHMRKTDAVILCSQYGKRQLYVAKMLAGITFGAISALLLFGITAFTSMVIYGPDGFDAALQIAFPLSSWKVSVGEAAVILLLLLIVLSVLYSVLVMFLSELFKSSVAVMAVPVGLMILTMMIDIPNQFRVLSQFYDLLPTKLLTKWELWDDRLVPIFGKYLTNVEAAPAMYLLVVVLLFMIGKKVYQKYQVGAR